MRIHPDVDEHGKEKMFTVSEEKLGLSRIVGRDDYGQNIEQRIPPLKGAEYCDRSGNELHLSLVNGRIATRQMIDKYLPPRHRENIQAGFLPKWECPLTQKYADMVRGPLIRPAAGETECSEVDPKTGCIHYRAALAKRREAAAKKAAKRRETHMRPTEAMVKLAESMRAEAGDAIGKRRKKTQAQTAASFATKDTDE